MRGRGVALARDLRLRQGERDAVVLGDVDHARVLAGHVEEERAIGQGAQADVFPGVWQGIDVAIKQQRLPHYRNLRKRLLQHLRQNLLKHQNNIYTRKCHLQINNHQQHPHQQINTTMLLKA